jgi:hypothetical protein
VYIAFPALPASLLDAALLRYAVDGSAFTALPSSGASWNAGLYSGASITTVEGHQVVDVGGGNGYVDLGSRVGTLIKSLPEFSIETYVYLPSETDLGGNGNFVWCFGSTDMVNSSAGSYMIFRSSDQVFSIAPASWNTGKSTAGKGNIEKGQWKHAVVTRALDGTVSVYINGALLSQTGGDVMNIDHTDPGFETLTKCYLAKPVFSGDKYLKDARYYRFNIYGRALNAAEVADGLGAGTILTAFNKTPVPAATAETYSKTSNAEKFVSFVLSTWHTGEWKAYSSSTGSNVHAGVSVSFNRNILTFTADDTDVLPGEYYVTVTGKFARESDRLKLTITPYVPPSRVITITFGGIPSDPITISGGDGSISQTGGPLVVSLNDASEFSNYQWWLDGEIKNSQTGSSYSIAVTGLSPGTHRVMIVAYKNGVPYSGETSFTVTN